MRTFIILLLFYSLSIAHAQVAINTDNSVPDPSSMLDVKSIDKGILLPRMTTAQRTAIASPASGLLVFDNTSGSFWFYSAGAWVELADQSSQQWTPNGSNISYSSGNVGVGDATPASTFTVGDGDKFQINGTEGDVVFTDDNATILFPATAIPNSPMLQMFSSGTQNADRMVISHSPAFPLWGLEYSDTIDIIHFRSGTGRHFSFDLGSGHFGIGVPDPEYPLDVHGTFSLVDGTQGAGKVLTSDANGIASWSNSVGSSWGIAGNSGTSAGSNFIGTTDNVPLVFKVNNLLAGKIDQILLNTSFGYVTLNSNTSGEQNTALGIRALYSNTDGSYNTASGTNALSFNTTGNGNTAHGSFALYSNTTGDYNTANGLQSMFLNTTGSNNTATGSGTLYENTTGSYNTATGHSALTYNTTGSNNTANGYFALNYNTNGYENTAIGVNALYFNTSGFQNTAVGMGALYSNTSGIYNTSTGWQSLYSNTTGGYNTADGYWALSYNTSGYRNTSTGFRSLTFNSTGANNTAHGADALLFNTEGFQNTAIGANSLYFNTLGAYNTAVGFNSGPGSGFLNNTTCLGIDAIATGSDMVRIGNIYVGSIGGYQNWTNISDSRFKENVKENVPGLNFVNQLRPVTYQLDRDKINEFNGVNAAHSKLKEQDPSLEFLKGDKYGQVTTGFIAQEVEAVAKNIGFEFSGVDAPNNENDFYGLRYAEFVVPLVKAVQELDLHDSSIRLILESQQTAIESQRLTMETQTKIIENQQRQIDELRFMVIEMQKTNK